MSGIWLISTMKFIFPKIKTRYLGLGIIFLAFCSEYLSPLVKHTAVFDYMDIVVIIIGGLSYCLILNKIEPCEKTPKKLGDNMGIGE